MYQQQLDLQFPLTRQYSLDLDVPKDLLNYLRTPYDISTASTYVSSDFNSVGTISSYLTVSNSNGSETARIDDQGISLRMENNSWLKTKVANWLGVKYL
tara:strand:+ start:4891 stop:5187 length:297 start_codon:yes stop_codon:yes gene_type:complete